MTVSRIAGLWGRLVQWAGVDRTVAFSLGLRVWNALAMPVTLSLIAKRLTAAEQGFYYSFAGVQGLAVLAELGTTFVVSQFAAHEFAVIRSETHSDQERLDAKARLASILRFGVLWNGVAAIICAVAVVPFGFWFFGGGKASVGINWMGPWVLFSLLSAVAMILAPLNAVLDGMGHMRDTTLVRLVQTIGGTLTLWGLLALGGELYAVSALPAWGFAGSLVGLALLHGETLRDMVRYFDTSKAVHYWAEIFPLQSKVALSWLAGYVGFYFSTPLIFRILSPEVAGRYGMTTNLLLSVSNIAQIWVATRGPVLAHKAALGDRDGMAKIFLSAAAKSCLIAISGYFSILVCSQIATLKSILPFLGRLLPMSVMLVLVAAFLFQHGYSILNSYIRAFKQDPLFWLSISSAALTVAVISPIGLWFGVTGIAALTLVCNFICFGTAIGYIYKRRLLR